MKYLIVGLGNIGPEYEDTRHNSGFSVLEAFAKASNAVFEGARYGEVTEVKLKGRALLLLKPDTYMNLSGKAVNYWMQKEKIPLENLLIVVDDLALPFGTLRLRGKGSDGGHNGLKNINALLGTTGYARLRFGIGNEFARGQQIDYVLGQWTEEEREKIPALLERSSEIIRSFVLLGTPKTMSLYNGK
ncbi:aminoacyl-tRNA hydrolase [Odoribacter lunatus]|uniref:aminoacyl-tRNA hydrolase n=1 Tax=Odoribacter lunatus TaxID=2941335 RepID=UPI002040FDE1|nr:aminoacyl-tRNA hydrolase [Odoribacter lunatus]